MGYPTADLTETLVTPTISYTDVMIWWALQATHFTVVRGHRADVQHIADRFSTYFLPVVAAIALLIFLLRRDPLATAAVLVVACSCSFALATPIAMLASIGASAKRGLLIKGGKYLELLAKADVMHSTAKRNQRF
jgi:hypothetical protein